MCNCFFFYGSTAQIQNLGLDSSCITFCAWYEVRSTLKFLHVRSGFCNAIRWVCSWPSDQSQHFYQKSSENRSKGLFLGSQVYSCIWQFYIQFFEEPPYASPPWLYPFIFPPIVQESSLFSTSSSVLILRSFFDEAHSNICNLTSHCSSDFHFSDHQ